MKGWRRDAIAARGKTLAVLSLFASTSTLVCCALPTLLVTVGLGAVVAGAISSLPWLVTLSRHKEWVFLGAGLLLAGNWALMWRRGVAVSHCEIPAGGPSVTSACDAASRLSTVVLWISTAIYVAGFLVAFLAFPVARALGWL